MNKKKFLIHASSLEDVPAANRGKLLPLLESHTLDWAKEKNPSAHKATLDLKEQLGGNLQNNKYFKYLRRLLELRFKEFNENNTSVPIDQQLLENLNVEILRMPEHLSCTQLGLWNFCERKWFWAYGLGLKKPKSSALLFGSAFDSAMNFVFEEKRKGIEAPLSAVHSAFYEAMEKGNEPNIIWENGDTYQKLLKHGPRVINTFLKEFNDKINPTAVQHDIKIHLDNGGLITGAIDILEEHSIIDNKTSKEFWKTEGPFAKAPRELQPKAYSLYYLNEYGRMPAEFKYCIVTKEEQPKTQFISFEVKKYEVENFKRDAQKVWDTIHEKLEIGKSAFKPVALEEKVPALCCKAYCQYFQECRNDGLKISERWDKEKKCHVYESEVAKT